MVEKLKEYWFPLLIGIFFVCITVYFAYDQNKGKLPGKTVNGQQIVFSVDDENFSADQIYDELSKTYYDDRVYTMFHSALLDNAVESTDEFISDIKTRYQNLVAAYSQHYGYDEAYLDNIAKTYYGYDTFYDYLLYSTKSEKLYAQYVSEHISELVSEHFTTEHKPRIISYVVLTMDDPDNPTAEEAEKLKTAQDAWASSEYSVDNFAVFAEKFSEDGNASNGGKFGYLDAETTGIDKTFLDTSLALEEGQVSEWVKSDEFGYFLIKCDSTKVDDFKEETDFISAILSENEGLNNKILWETAQKLNVKFGSDEIEAIVKKNLKVEDKESE